MKFTEYINESEAELKEKQLSLAEIPYDLLPDEEKEKGRKAVKIIAAELIARHVEKQKDVKESTKFSEYLDEGKISDFFGSAFSLVKSVINSVFNKLVDLLPGEEMIITIPSIYDVAEGLLVTEGAIESIKGNYNEALVCQIINETKIKTVKIDKKYGDKIAEVNKKVEYWDKMLSKAEGSTKEEIKDTRDSIYKGSETMAAYIIGSAREKGAIIKGAWIDNLGAATIGAENKGDIKIALEKDGEKFYDDISLKLYGGFDVNLFNTTPIGLIKNLFGEAAADELKKMITSNKTLSQYLDVANELATLLRNSKKGTVGLVNYFKLHFKTQVADDFDTIKSNIVKKFKDIFDKDTIKIIKNSNNIDELIPNLRSARGLSRTPINPILADLTYKVMKKYFASDFKTFAKNLMRVLGFDDKNTRMLMAVIETTKDGKHVSILDKHPDLNLKNIEIEHNTGTVSITIKAYGKIILTFGTKEGEKKLVFTKVKFSRKDTVDMDKYSDIAKIIGLEE